MKMKRREFLSTTITGVGGMILGSELEGAGETGSKYYDPVEIVGLGKTGIKLSRVGLGTGMRGGQRQSNQTKLGKAKFEALLRGAYERGIRWFDMADMYGSHGYLREAMKDMPREKIVFLSKIWWRPGGIPEKERLSPDILVERFCKELGTDYIDVVLLHCVTSGKWPEELAEQMKVMEGLKKKGIIRAHGVSCHALAALERAADEPWVDSVNARINPYGTKMDGPPIKVAAVLQKLHERGKGVVGMKIIGEGEFGDQPAKRDLSIDYALNLGCVDTMAVGFEKPEEIDDFFGRVRKTPRRMGPPALPNLDQSWYEDTSHLSGLIA